MTLTGRCAWPTHSSVVARRWRRRARRSGRTRSGRRRHREQHGERHPHRYRLDALVDLERDQRGQPESGRPPPPGHRQPFAVAHGLRVAARVSDTRPRVISDVVSTSLAVVRLDRDLPMPAERTTAMRASTCTARSTSSWRRDSGRWCPPGSPSRSRTAWSAWCIRDRVWLPAWAFRSSTARARSTPDTAVRSRWLSSTSIPSSRSRCIAVIGSPSYWYNGSNFPSWSRSRRSTRRAWLTPPVATAATVPPADTRVCEWHSVGARDTGNDEATDRRRRTRRTSATTTSRALRYR